MLTVDALHVTYGRLTALRRVSVALNRGEIVCIVGPNGAGKSSMLNAIAGGVVPQAGSICFEGRDLVGMRPEQIARLGISLVPEGRHVFSTLSVEENLRIGTFMRRPSAAVEEHLAQIMGYFPRLRERRSSPAGGLSGGEQQMLVIGRALMTAPRLVMVDEPSLGLAPKIIDLVYEILLELRQRSGLTLLINEQSSQRVLKCADRLYVLRNGKIQLEGRASSLQDGEAIMHAYFGFGAAAEAEAPA